MDKTSCETTNLFIEIMNSKRLVKRILNGHVVLIEANVMLYLYTRLIPKILFFKDFNLPSKKALFLLNNIDPFVCRLLLFFN